ncbi:hypothetical protein [Pyxidicoccus fallax]|uniref:hypothetical protein n=1 Tax=Pyxidicoccus fallax TaxID=394095 RepID=UPI001B7D4F77|nr:hypothetical protein [Pyxidicoccus fallax]
MRRTLACLVMLAAGCARNARPSESGTPAQAEQKVELTAPRYEHIFMLPVDRALAEATKLLKENGWVLKPMEDPKYLLTEWRSSELIGEAWGWKSGGDHIRYLVVGEPMAERQSIVRIFRMKRVSFSNDAEILYQGKTGELVWKHMEMAQFEQSFRRRGQPVTLATREQDTAPWVELDGVVQGNRDLELEHALTLRLESKPSLETLTGTLKLTRDDSFARDPSFYIKRYRKDVQAQEPCERDVAGVQSLLRPGQMVLIGEQLGTWEVPLTVGDMACEATGAGLGVTVGLAISHKEQERIDRYLSSAGTPADQDALLSGDFWRKLQQDGRGSRAVMDLIDRLRALRAAGRKVTVVAIDTDTNHGSARDARMARFVLNQRTSRPNDVFLVLAGNAHTRLVAEAAWSENFVPMSKHLLEAVPDLKVLEVGYATGRRWGCDLDPAGELECDVMGITPGPKVALAPTAPVPAIRMLPELDEDGFHGFLDVGALNVSLPAIALRGHELPERPAGSDGKPVPGPAQVVFKIASASGRTPVKEDAAPAAAPPPPAPAAAPLPAAPQSPASGPAPR